MNRASRTCGTFPKVLKYVSESSKENRKNVEQKKIQRNKG